MTDHRLGSMTMAVATHTTQAFVSETLRLNDVCDSVVSIDKWPPTIQTGLRVRAVTYLVGEELFSWDEDDIPDGLAVCAQVERCILALMMRQDTDVSTRVSDEFARLERAIVPDLT